MVTEWKPVASVPVARDPAVHSDGGPVYESVRAFLRARAGRVKQIALFDVLVLVMLATGAVDAVRNITWFGLAVVVLVPAAVRKLQARPRSPLRSARINRISRLRCRRSPRWLRA